MDKYRQITTGTLDDISETVQDIVRKREQDVEDDDNSPNVTVAGRKVNKVPSNTLASADDRAGDINFTSQYMYIAVKISDTQVEWRKVLLSTI